MGDQLRALRSTATSLSDYLNTAVRIRTQQDLLDLLDQRGIGTVRRIPDPVP